jgi:hypothetical protein
MQQLYSSSNGDTWSLVLDGATGRPMVRHEPNRASGGQASFREIGDFLTRDANGPQHAALLRLIATLVNGTESGVSATSGPTDHPAA